MIRNSVVWPCLLPPTEPQYFRFEGVWLTETGMAVLRNLSMSPLHKRRQRKTRLGPLNGEGGLEGGDPLGADEKKDGDLDVDDLKGEGALPSCGPCSRPPAGAVRTRAGACCLGCHLTVLGEEPRCQGSLPGLVSPWEGRSRLSA